MNLCEMMRDHESEIFARAVAHAEEVQGGSYLGADLASGLKVVFKQMEIVLDETREDTSVASKGRMVAEQITADASRDNARFAYHEGLTVGQLVNAYGAICQGITQYAHRNDFNITAQEFSQMNLCLDVAIAQAVTEYQNLTARESRNSENLRMGHLVHDLRNSLAGAILAHDIIRLGGVGGAGATSQVLRDALQRMKVLIDQSMAHSRMGGTPSLEPVAVAVFEVLSEVESALIPEASARSVRLQVQGNPLIWVYADRHLLTSAISNLVQNAVKFTKPRTIVTVHASVEGKDAVIQIEDKCGGIPDEHLHDLYKPYHQGDENRSGLGLGLVIAKRAIEMSGGTLAHENAPGVGCKFVIRLPIRELVDTPDVEIPGQPFELNQNSLSESPPGVNKVMDKEKEDRLSPNQVTVGDVLRSTESGKVGQGDTHLGRRPGMAVNSPNFTPDSEIVPEDRQEGHVEEPLKDEPVATPPEPLTLSDEERLTEPGQ